MKLIPHHQDDKAGRREYRSPDGTWRVTTAATPGGESTAVTTMAPKQRETPERSAEPPPPQPAPDAEAADHSLHRRNPLRRHPVVAVRRVPVRREADREGRRAGDLRKMPAIHDGDQLPETPRSDEDCEEDRPRGGPRLERPRLSAAVSNLDVATGPPGAAGLPDVRARAGCPRRTRPVSRGRNVQPPAANA